MPEQILLVDNDYVTNPFRMAELIVRVGAVLRRVDDNAGAGLKARQASPSCPRNPSSPFESVNSTRPAGSPAGLVPCIGQAHSRTTRPASGA